MNSSWDIFAQATPDFDNPVKLQHAIAMSAGEDWSVMMDVKGAGQQPGRADDDSPVIDR